jgi:ATP-binding cassette subfamily B (MDR/TAP) protein 1
MIRFDGVAFAYPSRQETPIYDNLNLTVEAGTTVALVGTSGSGKSTVVQLIERFYDPDQGRVLLDGTPLQDLNLTWLRSKIGLVSQEPVLFSGTVAENIALGKAGATKEEIIEAAKMANAHNFITQDFDKGYDTDVGEGGGKLSGGQKQRVAIARAMIKNPAILLLDEATSALDNESERVVQAALDELMARKDQRRTTVVIAHRLTTIRNADKIVVMEKGTVKEEGTHDELMALGGKYVKLSASLH